LAVPSELATPAQLWFEESGAFTQGFDRRVIDMASRHRGSLLPWATGKIGAGVSMAWRREALLEIGGFDLALDACGAHDLAAFFDALCAGYQIVFEPGALVHHEHRRTYDELRGQIYSHAVGLSAYLTRCLVTHPNLALDFVRRVPEGVRYGFAPSSIRNKKKSPDFHQPLRGSNGQELRRVRGPTSRDVEALTRGAPTSVHTETRHHLGAALPEGRLTRTFPSAEVLSRP